MTEVRVGRPSLMVQRRAEIIDAFIALVARNGLESVTLDDIAAEADVQRSSVRHFIGNRRALIAATIIELSDRYVRSVRDELSGTVGIDGLITMLFSAGWLAEMGDNDRAFDSLIEEAARDPQLGKHVRRACDALLAEIQSALRHDFPEAPAVRIRETAYALTCLVDRNKFLQRLGYPASLSRGAARAARALVRDLSA